MSKDMANEAITLPDLYYRVAKVCQGVRVLNLYPPTWEGGAWSIDSAGGTSSSISTSMAESLILAACVRWLVDNGHQPICIEKNNSNRTPSHYPQYLPKHFVVEIMDTPIYQQTFSDNLAIAALLAVEAVCKERGNA